MFPIWKESEIRKVQTSNDDDEAGGDYDKPKLECIIGASLVDDWGASSAVLDRIIRLYRSWYNRGPDHSRMGRDQNLRAISMASPQIKPENRVPALSSNG